MYRSVKTYQMPKHCTEVSNIMRQTFVFGRSDREVNRKNMAFVLQSKLAGMPTRI